jgi:hypothetical protein
MRVSRLIAGVALCLAYPAQAADVARPPVKTFEVPYRLTDTKHVLVRAKLNGKGPYNFLLDTGAPALFVSTAVSRKVGVEPDAQGWGTFERFEIEGGVVVPGARGRIEDPFQLEGMNGLGLAGAELHGIIGYTVLARYRVEFDFTRPKLVWTLLDFSPPAPIGLDGKATGGGLDAIGSVMKLLGTMLGKKAEPTLMPRGFLGVELADAADGVAVKTVLEGSPAASAGLKAGDRVTHFQGKSITAGADVSRLAIQLTAGTIVSLTVQRGTDTHTIRLKAGEGF